ncbi:ankyrin repeat-containing [Cystoisospora suis]|uniref:Ankyrin repeat-containing n=1 Tax=Cystoisospora suis TaxID=483139 RepID=A0A2C6JYH4_9APIC|nr:ankyrin repeat-containing [Cystoisospora suis]
MSALLVFQTIRDHNGEQLTLLLEQRPADVNYADSNGTTPLTLAAQLDKASLVEILLAKGADPTAQERLSLGGNTALHYAAENNSSEVAVKLLRHGAQANVQNRLGHTPLHTACRFGHADIVRILQSKGADAGSRDYSGRPQKGAFTMDLTLKHSSVDVIPVNKFPFSPLSAVVPGFTPSFWAKTMGHDACLVLLPPPQFYGSKQISEFQLVTMDALDLTLKVPTQKSGKGKAKNKKK